MRSAYYHRRRTFAGQRLFAAFTSREGSPHLNTLAVVGRLERVGGTRRPIDFRVVS